LQVNMKFIKKKKVPLI